MPRFSLKLLVFLSLVSTVTLLTGCPEAPVEGAPKAHFTASPIIGSPPHAVQFTDTSDPGASPIRSWIWSFGNGDTSTRQNPVYTYNEAGIYTISLTVTTAFGSDTRTVDGLVRIEDVADFVAIGPDGGSGNAAGVGFSVPAGALEKETVFGVAKDRDPFVPFPSEPMLVVSSSYTISQNGDTDKVSYVDDSGRVEAATISIPYFVGSVPFLDREPAKVHILARHAHGPTIPLLGKLVNGNVVAPILRLPALATYAVVYRPEAELVDVAVTKVTPTGMAWAGNWELSVSEELLQQLTALRLGEIGSPEFYGRRDFFPPQLEATTDELVETIAAIQERLVAEGLRAPLLSEDGAYTVVCYNLSPVYSVSFDSFQDLLYRDHGFGQVVIDPLQLLNVCEHNAIAVADDPEDAANLNQELNFSNAFAQELFEASFEGYAYPVVTEDSAADGGPVDVLAGIKAGAATYTGQTADGIDFARSFEENEFALLSTPLLFPFDATLPGYDVASQDLLFYVRNLVDETKEDGADFLIGEILEALCSAFDALPADGIALEFDEARLITYGVIDDVLGTAEPDLGGLSAVYELFARDLGIENSDAAMLRPKDEEGDPYVLNKDRFEEEALVEVALQAPTDTAIIGGEDAPALDDIPGLSSRAIVLGVVPLTTELTLTFNVDEWTFDDAMRALAVHVYRPGEAGVSLLEDGLDENNDGLPETIRLAGFEEDPMDCLAEVDILISNVSLARENSITIVAEAVSVLDRPEYEVLEGYVAACDPDYEYQHVVTTEIAGLDVEAHLLKLTSGAWRGSMESEQVLWTHYVTIIEPPVITSNTALLVVAGGSTDSMPSSSTQNLLLPFSVATSSVAVHVTAVPNQPQYFTDESRSRSEDEIIAYSFDKYATAFPDGNADMTWPALLPMTRAAMRAMDAAQDFMANGRPVKAASINDFVVMGASKRGWTTWLTAIADRRVRAIIPVVSEILNLQKQMEHHYLAYGEYSSALEDYEEVRIIGPLGNARLNRIAEPEGKSLQKIVDPYQQRRRLNMPIMVTNSTGDQFFLPDSARFYFDDLPGEAYLWYAPNTDHSLSSSQGVDLEENTLNSVLAFYASIITETDRPSFSWSVENGNRIVVQTETQPLEVRLWHANNRSARDFRLETIGEAWTGVTLDAICEAEGEKAEGEGEGEGEGETCDSGLYIAEVEEEEGWTAFFVQVLFPGPIPELEEVNFGFSTEMVILPDTYPDFK